MDQRLEFIAACLAEDETMTEICEGFQISRKTGYKWLLRYRAYGAAGLQDRPRAPLVHGGATDAALVRLLLDAKMAHPLWGPKKLIARLKRVSPMQPWPAVSSAGEILKRHGLVGRRRLRWRAMGNGPWPEPSGPNVVWSVDHKGWFRTRDGQRCEPLTVMDSSSRYLLALEALTSTSVAAAWPVFERLFAEYGLPERIRSDNGTPFASVGITGMTELSKRFVQLGIVLERIAPGKPQQNGRHERFHLTMLPLAKTPCANAEAQQAAFDAFRASYNCERPHEALDQTPPAEHYAPSQRPVPSTLPDPLYPREAAVRRVRNNGQIKWGGQMVYVSETLAHQSVAVEETDTGDWAMRFYNHPIGIIDPKTHKLKCPKPKPNPETEPK
jgi:transposase InsO family protein